MKKILFIALLAFVSGLTVTSCTDEVIAPKDDSGSNNGGTTGDPMPKP
jgi:hypothetical protein